MVWNILLFSWGHMPWLSLLQVSNALLAAKLWCCKNTGQWQPKYWCLVSATHPKHRTVHTAVKTISSIPVSPSNMCKCITGALLKMGMIKMLQSKIIFMSSSQVALQIKIKYKWNFIENKKFHHWTYSLFFCI